MPVSGRHDRRVLFGAFNPRTAHRIVVQSQRETGPGARALLAELRRRYRAAPTIWVLLDRGPAHTAAPTQRLATELNIQLIWLPKQWPEWNAMDQLWRELNVWWLPIARPKPSIISRSKPKTGYWNSAHRRLCVRLGYYPKTSGSGSCCKTYGHLHSLNQTASGYETVIQLLQNGVQYCNLVIPSGSSNSDLLDGINLLPLEAEAAITMNVLLKPASAAAGAFSPGRDLTVTVRL